VISYRETWDLSTIPTEVFNAEIGRRRKGDDKSGGRPPILRRCPDCKQELTGRQFARHRCKRA
jgi:hypothetical protein